MEEEPPFLSGQTKLSIDMSPVKIVKVTRVKSNCMYVFKCLCVYHFQEIYCRTPVLFITKGPGHKESTRELGGGAGLRLVLVYR